MGTIRFLFLAAVCSLISSCAVDLMKVYDEPFFRMKYSIIRGENTVQPWGTMWLPSVSDVVDMDKRICTYFKERYKKSGDAASRAVLLKYEDYRIQYCGFIRDGRKMIFCHLFLDGRNQFPTWQRLSEFAGLMVSGGDGVLYLYLIYDTASATFIDYWGKGS